MKTNTPYGFWPSPISADQLGSATIRYSEVKIHKQKIYWLESRPAEKGRSVLVEYDAGHSRDLLPSTFSVRTRAQEYGGSCYAVTDQFIYFVNDQDQAIFALDLDNQHIQRLSLVGNFRYADLWVDQHHQGLLAVRETVMPSTHPITDIVSVNLSNGELISLISGNDFYSNPRISPCGNKLSYLTWNHPDMPWDSSYCVVCELNEAGFPLSHHSIAGSKNESIFQPQWSPDNQLFFVSDKSNWWNLYRWDGTSIQIVYEMPAEFATPQWVFGMSTYGFLDENYLLCCYSQSGQWMLAKINWQTNQLISIENSFCDISNIVCDAQQAVFIAASTYSTSAIYAYKENTTQVLTATSQLLNPDDISIAQAISFPTEKNETAYGFFYPPTNSKIFITNNTKPPLIVFCHGGPTGACETGLNLKIQFWTSRGFAVVDVNYRGSTGYGRQYRDALKKSWGIKDVTDVCNAANFLINQHKVDSQFSIIRGSSAGGFTVLAALTFTNQFAIGCSLYGIGDLEALAKDTHKFEAHYLDSLVGDYPEQRDVYVARSPIHHIEQLNCPVIFFQGLEDKVVPPAQAEAMVNALKNKKIPVEYIHYTNEGHGFRQADNIKSVYENELAFYQRFLSGN